MKRHQLRKNLRKQLEGYISELVDGYSDSAHCSGAVAEVAVREELLKIAGEMSFRPRPKRFRWLKLKGFDAPLLTALPVGRGVVFCGSQNNEGA
jgi:hypothetical protein